MRKAIAFLLALALAILTHIPADAYIDYIDLELPVKDNPTPKEIHAIVLEAIAPVLEDGTRNPPTMIRYLRVVLYPDEGRVHVHLLIADQEGVAQLQERERRQKEAASALLEI